MEKMVLLASLRPLFCLQEKLVYFNWNAQKNKYLSADENAVF